MINETQNRAVAAVLFMFAAVPVVAWFFGDTYSVTLFARIAIFAIAVVGLNLALGYGGQVSLGHGLYLGIGMYAVGILSFHGISNGWVHLAVGLAIGSLVALIVGWICLKTEGIGFIMITLAFAQMGYFLVVSLRTYGGDDGMSIAARSDFFFFELNGNNVAFYYLCVAVLAALVFGLARVVKSPFGMVLNSIRQNEARVAALGFPVGQYKLAAYVASALVCVVAGALQANLFRYASPATMSWLISGELVVMIVLGGMRNIIGPVIGAAVLVLFEELISNFHLGGIGGLNDIFAERWMMILGAFIVVASLSKDGIMGTHWFRRQKEAEQINLAIEKEA